MIDEDDKRRRVEDNVEDNDENENRRRVGDKYENENRRRVENNKTHLSDTEEEAFLSFMVNRNCTIYRVGFVQAE